MLAQRLADHDDTPVDDKIVVLRGATWADYQRVLEMRGEVSSPRVAYHEGALQLTIPSRQREGLKSTIGCLVEVWCLENEVEFSGYGSWTLESKKDERGVEPDECYVFGNVSDPERPDLAIEVVWTSGGIDKLEIYRKLGVREVWFWRDGRVQVYERESSGYRSRERSELIPTRDLVELAVFAEDPDQLSALKRYRQKLQSG